MSIVAAVCACVSACGSDDSIDPTPPKPGSNLAGSSDITFTVDLPQGNGNGSNSSPVVVEKGEKLNMAISQKSRYVDPDGSVFSCEPKAVIQLSATLDTVCAKDIEALTKVKEGSEVKSNKTGTTPVRNQVVQTFDIGGQSIVFDLSHEVYTYVNSIKEKIEMPYVKPNLAKFGSSGAVEEEGATRSAAVITGVTIRPVAKTRTETITDSTMYEVNVRFNLEVECMNAKEDTKQTLEFSVNYIGVVETVTELPDPIGEISYVWDVKSGTKSIASPFIKEKEDAMEIWLAQTSSYIDKFSNKALSEPKAKIKLSVAKDTVWAKNVDELKGFAEKTQNLSGVSAANQKFSSALQDIDVEWSYENCEATLAGETVSMPFYSLTPVTVKDVSVKEVDEVFLGKDFASVYDVTVTFSQKAIANNTTAPTPEVEIEYVANYVGMIRIYLVDVEYYPGGEWVDAHDNLALAFYPKVERYRTYSNGKRVGPDTFYDYGHFVEADIGQGYVYKRFTYESGQWVEHYRPSAVFINDSVYGISQKTQFSDLASINGLVYSKYIDQYAQRVPKDWKTYRLEQAIDDTKLISAKDVETSAYEKDDRPSGWYWNRFLYCLNYDAVMYSPEGQPLASVLEQGVDFGFYDAFLVIDGRRIDFAKLHNLKFRHTRTEKDFSDPDKEGKILRFDLYASYLGKNFNFFQIDTFYVDK